MHSIFARQSSGNRSGGFAASSRRPRQSFLSRDLWVQGNDALPSYREGNTCASPGLGERTEVWKPSVSRPSCSSCRKRLSELAKKRRVEHGKKGNLRICNLTAYCS